MDRTRGLIALMLLASAAPQSASAAISLRASLTHGADVYPDPVNRGYYYLKYPPRAPGSSPFQIMYQAGSNFIGIELLKTPLGRSRKLAEQTLMHKLRMSPREMCRLSYQISAPNSVSQSYAGEDLRFSFCPDAVHVK